jgi:hypothetical protein
LDVAAHQRSGAQGNGRRRKVSNDACTGLEDDAFIGHDVAGHRTADHDVSAAKIAPELGRLADLERSLHGHAALDSSEQG